MSIPVNVNGTWKETSEQYVNVSGKWKKCRNVYINKDGSWYSVFNSTYSTTKAIKGSNTYSVSNVIVGSIVTVSGTVNNNVYDSSDYYNLESSGLALLTGSIKWGPSSGTYTNTYTATNSDISITTTNQGMSSISATISCNCEYTP